MRINFGYYSYFKMFTFGGRSIFSPRSTVQKARAFTGFTPLHSPRTLLSQHGYILTRIPKMTPFLWGAMSISPCMVMCQGAPSTLQTTREKAVAWVQVDKLVFALRLSLRALVLLLRFGPLLLLYPLTWVSSRWASRWLDVLLWLTESSGVTFIKLGQWASTRRDIFSRDFCDRFARLHAEVRPHPWHHTERHLWQAFGDGWRKLLAFDGTEPVGCGCVAQVYRGSARVDGVVDRTFQSTVKEVEGKKDPSEEAWEIPGFLRGVPRLICDLWSKKGREDPPGSQPCGSNANVEHWIPVAIKVLHPGIKMQVEMDFLLMRAGSQLLHHLPGLKWLSLPEIVEEFGKVMTRQIDLRFEARNIERFRENFKNMDCVKFPTPLLPFVTNSILVETFEDSEPITNYLRSGVPRDVGQRLAKIGVQTLLKMVFVDNFVHGDLHPGNILVQQRGDVLPEAGGTSSSGSACTPGETWGKTLTHLWATVVGNFTPQPEPLQLVLLDAGMVAQLSERDLANLKAVVTAVVLRQGERVAELFLHHARANECRDVSRFKREMAQLVDHALRGSVSLGKLQVADLLTRVFGLLITHKVKLESNFASVVLAVMVLEGLGRSLDPELDILEMAKPLLLKNLINGSIL